MQHGILVLSTPSGRRSSKQHGVYGWLPHHLRPAWFLSALSSTPAAGNNQSSISFKLNHDHLQPYPEPLIHLPIQPSVQPVLLGGILAQALRDPLHASCTAVDCGSPLQQSRLQLVLGQVLIVNLARLGNHGAVIHSTLHPTINNCILHL